MTESFKESTRIFAENIQRALREKIEEDKTKRVTHHPHRATCLQTQDIEYFDVEHVEEGGFGYLAPIKSYSSKCMECGAVDSSHARKI